MRRCDIIKVLKMTLQGNELKGSNSIRPALLGSEDRLMARLASTSLRVEAGRTTVSGTVYLGSNPSLPASVA